MSKFERLIEKEEYQVFLFCCPTSMPFGFAAHPWFVINRKGEISRWEVGHRKRKNSTSWGHLHKNLFLPFSGIEVFIFSEKYFWKPKLLGFISGGERSVAHKMAELINGSDKLYDFCYHYSLTGPNSNTYAQWVLNKFPEFKAKLPWNAIGRGY